MLPELKNKLRTTELLDTRVAEPWKRLLEEVVLQSRL